MGKRSAYRPDPKPTQMDRLQQISVGFGSRPEKQNNLKKPIKVRRVFSGCTALERVVASLETGDIYRYTYIYFKLREPLDHATQNVPPDSGGGACVVNEDLDTRAAQNRSLLSTGQGLSYTHCPPAGTRVTNNIINQHLVLQDSVL